MRVTRVAFTGVSPSVLSELRAALTTRPSSRWPWGRRTYFSNARLADDLRRIEAWYAEHGFANAKVDTYDVEMPLAVEVAITFHVVEGLPVHIESVETFGFEVLSEPARVRLLGELGLQAGAVRTRAAVDRARERPVPCSRGGLSLRAVDVLEAKAPPGRRRAHRDRGARTARRSSVGSPSAATTASARPGEIPASSP